MVKTKQKIYTIKRRNTKRRNTKRRNTKRFNTRRCNTRRCNTRRCNTRRCNTRRCNTRRCNTKRRNIKRRNTNKIILKHKGGGETSTICSMCEENNCDSNCLSPRKCLKKNPMNPHRICNDCWFNEKTGFAREGVDHTCPGCKKNIPLPPLPKSNYISGEVIDLIDSSDDET